VVSLSILIVKYGVCYRLNLQLMTIVGIFDW